MQLFDILFSYQSIFTEHHIYTAGTSQNSSQNIIKYITEYNMHYNNRLRTSCTGGAMARPPWAGGRAPLLALQTH